MYNKLSVISVTLLSSALVAAEPWVGQADLGWTSNSGNSESTSLNAQLGLERDLERWKHALTIKANGSTSENDQGEDETNAERYSGEWKSDRKLDERSYLFGVVSYVDDRKSGYDFEGSTAIGYGYNVIAEESLNLILEIGPGYKHSLLSSAPAAGSRHIEEFTYRIGEGLTWNFSEGNEFKQYLTYEGGDDLSTLKVGAYVRSALSEAMALKVGVDTTKRSGDAQDAARDIDPTLDDTDTTTYANISYSF